MSRFPDDDDELSREPMQISKWKIGELSHAIIDRLTPDPVNPAVEVDVEITHWLRRNFPGIKITDY